MQTNLNEITLSETIVPENVDDEMKQVLADLEIIRDMMIDFGVLTGQQGEQLDIIAKNVTEADKNVESGKQNLLKASTFNHRSKLTRVAAAVAGGGIGLTGFLAGPVVGVSTVAAGGTAGWLLSSPKINLPIDL